jgi:hypothetical protein
MTSEKHSRGPSLSNEQILQLGEMTKKSHPVIAIIYQKLVAQYQLEVANTEPNETRTREWYWLKDRALKEVVADMGGLLDHGERVYAELQQQNSPEYQRQQREDTQGFGLNFDESGAQTS